MIRLSFPGRCDLWNLGSYFAISVSWLFFGSLSAGCYVHSLWEQCFWTQASRLQLPSATELSHMVMIMHTWTLLEHLRTCYLSSEASVVLSMLCFTFPCVIYSHGYSFSIKSTVALGSCCLCYCLDACLKLLRRFWTYIYITYQFWIDYDWFFATFTTGFTQTSNIATNCRIIWRIIKYK